MFRTPAIPRRRISPGRKGSHLPKGECRFILLHPELQGQRCACVGFCLNDNTPGSTCECGHQACYHVGPKEDAADREEIETLKDKIKALEEEFSREKQNGELDSVCRISELEEMVDRYKAEIDMEIKGVYRDVGGLWQNVGTLQNGLQKWAKQYDDHIEALIDANHSSRSDVANFEKRLIDIDDASMKLEERVEVLEGSRRTILSHRKKAPNPSPISSLKKESRDSEDEQVLGPAEGAKTTGNCSESWTVHISLLPTASTPMPFEKDTLAYKRCLSRGLHRMLAVPKRDAESFNKAVSDAFVDFLQGRSWMPLVAKLCDVVPLFGLPMLRQLPQEDIDITRYNYEWLSKNCATCATDGKIADLYIAMIDESLTWAEIKRAPMFIPDLEACWESELLTDEASAGDILPNVIRSSKRPGSALSNFNTGEGELCAKRARMNVAESVDRLRTRLTEAA